MRTRFAPSPTGYLHVGGLRTALYSYLLAKKHGGSFILRIEDTDVERSTPGAIESILRTLHWAGLNPDEGVILREGRVTEIGPHGPYIQSKRLHLYREHAEGLYHKGFAYPCFCSPERLTEMRKEQEACKQAPMYDRRCLALSPEEVQQKVRGGEPHVLRLKIPHEEIFTFDDSIRGRVTFRGDTIDDQVLLKSDGFPTYHLAHVADDHLMEIDTVIRGEEWLSSVPKHLLLFQCFGWKPPQYAHVPLLLNKTRAKLSKRDGAVAVEDYIAKGYVPEALLNFIALLGWNPGTTQELFSLQELIEAFSLERVQKGGAVFDAEKLDWLQGQWMRKMAPEEFAKHIHPLIAEKFSSARTDGAFAKKAALIQGRITFFTEATEMLAFFYEEPTLTRDLLVHAKQGVTAEILPKIVHSLLSTLEKISDAQWQEENLEAAIQNILASGTFKKGQLLWPLRSALTGRLYSPGAFEVAAVLGREKVLERLRRALNTIHA